MITRFISVAISWKWCTTFKNSFSSIKHKIYMDRILGTLILCRNSIMINNWLHGLVLNYPQHPFDIIGLCNRVAVLYPTKTQWGNGNQVTCNPCSIFYSSLGSLGEDAIFYVHWCWKGLTKLLFPLKKYPTTISLNPCFYSWSRIV